MKKLVLLCCSLFLFASCSSDDSTGGEKNKNTLRLKSMERISYQLDQTGNKIFNDKRTEQYFYGSNGYSNKVITTVVFDTISSALILYENFEYNGNSLKQRTASYEDYYNKNTDISTYVYHNNLITKETINRNKQYVDIINYNYNSSENLIDLEILNGEELRASATFTYDDNGNVIKESFKSNFDDSNHTLISQYDNKNNPLNNVFPKAYLKTIQVGKNNIIDTDGQKIEYEYNEQGYPTKAVSSDRTTIYEYY